MAVQSEWENGRTPLNRTPKLSSKNILKKTPKIHLDCSVQKWHSRSSVFGVISDFCFSEFCLGFFNYHSNLQLNPSPSVKCKKTGNKTDIFKTSIQNLCDVLTNFCSFNKVRYSKNLYNFKETKEDNLLKYAKNKNILFQLVIKKH